MDLQGGVFFYKSRIFLFSCLAFIVGLALASFLPAEIKAYEIWWFAAAVFFLILTVRFWSYSEENGLDKTALAALLLAIFILAVWRYGLSLPADAPDKIWHYNNRTVAIKGLVVNEPDIREINQKLEIAVKSVNGLPDRTVSGKILATVALYPEYNYGDEVELAGSLEAPAEFNGFAYDRYLSRFDIYSVSYYPALKLILPGQGSIIYKKIFAFKGLMAGLIDSGMSVPESGLARPIVFGGQKGLEEAVRQNFQKTGLTHIMAVSGFNVSILAAVVMATLLAAGLNRRQAFYLAAIFLAAYIILVGAPASAARAGLMGFLVLWALKLGRLNKITNSLVLTAAVLLFINPKLLRDDVGFQLSFSAIAGLVYVYPTLQALWQKLKLPKFKGLSDALLITLAAQVFTLPILAYNFSQISLIAPLANLAVLWALPVLTGSILIALPLSFFLPALSFLFFLPAYLLSKYILFMANFFAKAPCAYIEASVTGVAAMAVYYFFAVFLIIKLRQTKLLKEGINGKI